jgi:DUF1365 family protein
MAMDKRYAFRVGLPDEHASVAIRNIDAEGPILPAALTGTRKELGDRTIALALLAYPLMTLKVIAAIHWHALRLWWKGCRSCPVLMRLNARSRSSTGMDDLTFTTFRNLNFGFSRRAL